ncbi:MAG: pyrimidine-nucleoside phosphorylase [Elusimicrobia bacterium RIFOXYD2_FULL_34_15]|nr:MAG: pyrimidine-nucleoside phosphorylase [Elusimicrobia bacterium RIFOXYD2_FULL_34_15]
MRIYDLILKKRDGEELSKAEISFIINGFVKGGIADYQMSAFLMAVYFRGMTSRESVNFTIAMADSGEKIDLSSISGFKVDKHSTGGVGDKTTLVLAPLVAACGGKIAKMSGCGLGHTGGTIDKLESIPGFKTSLTKEKFIKNVNKIGLAIMGQTAQIVPADKLIYALRDVTATVDSIPLIAASIMSKKLASGSNGIVLDVKTGSGAFMQKYEDALELAKLMVNIGENADQKTVALITNMDEPLGYAIGNSIEVKEAIDTLNGTGPKDLTNLCIELGGNMLLISGLVKNIKEGKGKIKKAIYNKSGLEKFKELVKIQDGNPAVVQNPSLLPQCKKIIEIKSEKSGYIEKINSCEVGIVSQILGAGRKTKNDTIDLSVGIYLKKKISDKIKKGETLAIFHTDGNKNKTNEAKDRFLNAYKISNKKVTPSKLLFAKITKNKVEIY